MPLGDVEANCNKGTLDEALGWLEYCNSDRNTYYANLRRKNGREKPYNVRDRIAYTKMRPLTLLFSRSSTGL